MIAHLAALKESAGYGGVSREPQAAAGKAGVLRVRRDGFHGALGTNGEAVGIDAPPVGFWAAADRGAGIEVQADEDRVWVAVCKKDAVIGAQHDRVEGAAEFAAEAVR